MGHRADRNETLERGFESGDVEILCRYIPGGLGWSRPSCPPAAAPPLAGTSCRTPLWAGGTVAWPRLSSIAGLEVA